MVFWPVGLIFDSTMFMLIIDNRSYRFELFLYEAEVSYHHVLAAFVFP